MKRNLSIHLLGWITTILFSLIKAYPTVSTQQTGYEGQLSYIVDGDFSSYSNCLTMKGSWAYVTIDYGEVKNIKTIFLLGYQDGVEEKTWTNLQVFAHTVEDEYSVQCPVNPSQTGFYDCQADAQYVTLAQFDENAEFTICEVAVYEEVNIVGNVRDPITIAVGGSSPEETTNAHILNRKAPIYTNI